MSDLKKVAHFSLTLNNHKATGMNYTIKAFIFLLLTQLVHNVHAMQTINPLHLAAKNGDIPAIYELVKTIPVNQQDTFGFSALHVAAFHNQAKALNTLISLGAKAKITNVHGITPIHLTSNSLCLRIFLNACGNNCINTQDHYGNTPLLIAITNNRHNAYIKELIKWRADINIPNTGGLTPLYCATVEGNTEIMKSLIFAGAELDTKNHTHDTAPLHIAAMKEDPTCLQILLNAEARVDIPGIDDNFTPLHIAALYNRPENIKILLDAGANYTIKSILRKTTPLDLAIEYNNHETIDIFRQMTPQAFYQEDLSENDLPKSVTPPLEVQDDIFIRPQPKRFNKPRKRVIKNVFPAYRATQIPPFKRQTIKNKQNCLKSPLS